MNILLLFYSTLEYYSHSQLSQKWQTKKDLFKGQVVRRSQSTLFLILKLLQLKKPILKLKIQCVLQKKREEKKKEKEEEPQNNTFLRIHTSFTLRLYPVQAEIPTIICLHKNKDISDCFHQFSYYYEKISPLPTILSAIVHNKKGQCQVSLHLASFSGLPRCF